MEISEDQVCSLFTFLDNLTTCTALSACFSLHECASGIKLQHTYLRKQLHLSSHMQPSQWPSSVAAAVTMPLTHGDMINSLTTLF